MELDVSLCELYLQAKTVLKAVLRALLTNKPIHYYPGSVPLCKLRSKAEDQEVNSNKNSLDSIRFTLDVETPTSISINSKNETINDTSEREVNVAEAINYRKLDKENDDDDGRYKT